MSPVVGRTVECARVAAMDSERRRAGAHTGEVAWHPAGRSPRSLPRVLQAITTEAQRRPLPVAGR